MLGSRPDPENHVIATETDTETRDKEMEVVKLKDIVPSVEEPKSYTELTVSPVPTPSVFRPQLPRSDPRMSRQERLDTIIHGRMDIECPVDDRVIRLYIHSSSSGKFSILFSMVMMMMMINRIFIIASIALILSLWGQYVLILYGRSCNYYIFIKCK